jgi:hypothetical protein
MRQSRSSRASPSIHPSKRHPYNTKYTPCNATANRNGSAGSSVSSNHACSTGPNGPAARFAARPQAPMIAVGTRTIGALLHNAAVVASTRATP